MTRIALKSAWARKRRLLGAFLAVFLGVSFLSGTLVLGETLERNFDGLFADANAGTDAVVRSATKINTDVDFERGPISPTTVERIRGVDGVASAAPYVEGYGQLLDKHGEAIGGNGPPRVAASWIGDPELNAYRLVEVAPPAPTTRSSSTAAPRSPATSATRRSSRRHARSACGSSASRPSRPRMASATPHTPPSRSRRHSATCSAAPIASAASASRPPRPSARSSSSHA